MPLVNRVVEPIRVAACTARSSDARPIPGETPHAVTDRELDIVIDTFSNRALVTALRQLSNVAKQADDICDELTVECQTVVRRAGRLSGRVVDLSQTIAALDSKTVTVPVSTLVESSQTSDHLHSDYDPDSGLFRPESRPGCVRSLYGDAALTPVEAIRSCDRYRTDGRSGAQLFQVSPVTLREECQSPDLGTAIHTVVLVGDEFDRQPKELPSPKPRPHSFPSTLTELDVDTHRQRELPTPEEKLHTMSKSQPAALVAIDVSGTSFERLCEYRVSGRNVQQPEYGSVDRRSMRKKRHRRKTLSGVPGFDEVNISVPYVACTSGDRRQRPCSISFNDYAPRSASEQTEDPERPSLKRSSSIRKSLRNLFRVSRSKSSTLWVEERTCSPDPPIVDLPSGRRSRSVSLTKSLRSVRESLHKFISPRSASTDRAHKVERGSTLGHGIKERTQNETEKVKRPSRMQWIGKKLGIIRSHSQQQNGESSNSPMTRSRSMDACTINAVHQQPVQHRIPAYQSTMALTDSRGGVQHDPAWIRRFADVKLRDNLQMGAHHENRQSSSGNWSGSTDSARQSLTSECTLHAYPRVPECTSEASLDKDSAVSLTIHYPNDRHATNAAVHAGIASNGDTSTFTEGATVETDAGAKFTKMSTEEWLRNLNMKRCCKPNDGVAGAPKVLTQKNLIAHDQSLTALHRLVSAEDDGGSSVYSVDQDGYYTSMHRDCGVGHGGARSDLIPDFTAGGSHCIVKSRKNPFFVGNTPRGKGGSQGKAKKTPPAPPPRVSTMLDRSIVRESNVRSNYMNVDDMRKIAMCPSAFPMSPVDNDIDDDYAGEWRQQVSHARTGLKSTMSAPGCLSNYANRSTITASVNGAKMDCIAEVSNESSADQSCSSVDDCMLPRYQRRHDDNTSDGYSTWPRSPRNVLGKRQTESILKNGGTSSKQRPTQTLIFAPIVNIYDDDDKDATTYCGIPQVHSPDEFLAKQRMLAKNAPLHYAPSLQSQADVPYSSNISTWPRLIRTNTSVPASPQIQEPVAAPARLIISSPVAGQAAFVENPHKRVLCSPVTTEDLIAFSTCSSPKCQRVPAMRPAVTNTTPSYQYHSAPPDCIIQSPTVNEIPSSLPFTDCSAFKPVSQPLFPSLSAMKHSIPFPVPNAQTPVKPTAATRSWYDGMHTKVYDSPLGEHNDVLRTSLLKESSEYPVVQRPRRDSNASTMSTHSSSSSRRSVTFATVHRSSSASLVTKLDRAVSSSLLSVPEQTAGVGVKRSRSTCSSSSGSEASWRHKYAPSSLRPGVIPPTLPTFTTFAKHENDAKRPRVGMETNDTRKRTANCDHEAVVNEAYHFQMAPANMTFTGFTSLQQVSLAGNVQPCKKIKPKVPQRNCSMKDTKVESERLPFGSSVFGAAETNGGQSRVNGATLETFTLADSTFVRSYAPPKFVVPKRDVCSAARTGTDGVLFNGSRDLGGPVQSPYCDTRNIVNNQCINISYNDITNANVLVNGTSRVATHDISSKKTEPIYSSKLAFLSKNIADARSVDRRFSEHQLGLSASCSSLAKDKVTLRSDGSHVSSLQGLSQGKTDTGIAKGDDQSSCPLVSPAVSSLSSSGLGSSVASSPDSRPNSPDLTDAPGESEMKSQSNDVCCKT